MVIASQAGVDQMLAAAKALDKKWHDDHDAFTAVYRSNSVCRPIVPERAKRAWASHDAAIAAWGIYYDALQQSYRSEDAQYRSESTRLDSEQTRLQQLRAAENLDLIRAKQRAERDRDPLYRQVVTIRERSLADLDRSLEHLAATRTTIQGLRERTTKLETYLEHARKAVVQQDSSWDNFYRGQLLAMRAQARVDCPDVFEAQYRTIEPTK